MPSIPPPVPHSSTYPTPMWASPPVSSAGQRSWINWSAVLTSASVSFALVVGILAWIATHPHKTTLAPQPTSVATVDTTAEPALPPPVFSVVPAVHRARTQDMIAKSIPLVEEEPPPLPPPSDSPAPRSGNPFADLMVSKAPPAQNAGETYGTQVLFHNNQAVAADLARREHKLLFVMHISGNFEDSCFT